ncbi:hypothetical protein DT594_10980 [Halopseudomonas laoshanensis]|uniref:Uncharacterized protein n=1 Tax=Halopseudomonas laoshanensis TaxID=2268758 RepID=A0A7V7GSZ9_9GAMM|nr:hypothetical protein DT594_10980 [Halopseudomonas laoshanensis]
MAKVPVAQIIAAASGCMRGDFALRVFAVIDHFLDDLVLYYLQLIVVIYKQMIIINICCWIKWNVMFLVLVRC